MSIKFFSIPVLVFRVKYDIIIAINKRLFLGFYIAHYFSFLNASAVSSAGAHCFSQLMKGGVKRRAGRDFLQ